MNDINPEKKIPQIFTRGWGFEYEKFRIVIATGLKAHS